MALKKSLLKCVAKCPASEIPALESVPVFHVASLVSVTMKPNQWKIISAPSSTCCSLLCSHCHTQKCKWVQLHDYVSFFSSFNCSNSFFGSQVQFGGLCTCNILHTLLTYSHLDVKVWRMTQVATENQLWNLVRCLMCPVRSIVGFCDKSGQIRKWKMLQAANTKWYNNT